MKSSLIVLLALTWITLSYCFEQPDDMDDEEYIKILRQFAGDDVDPKLSVKQLKKMIKKKYGGDVQMGFSNSKNGEPIQVGFGSDEL